MNGIIKSLTSIQGWSIGTMLLSCTLVVSELAAQTGQTQNQAPRVRRSSEPPQRRTTTPRPRTQTQRSQAERTQAQRSQTQRSQAQGTTQAPRSNSPNRPIQRRPSTGRSNPGRQQGLRVAQRNPRASQTQVPRGFPLSKAQQARIDKILEFWEAKTSAVKTFQCSYRRDEFDPARMAMHRMAGGKEKPANFSFGEIRFAEPDKGLMIDSKSYGYNPPKKAEDKEYKLLSETFNQHWVCDGKSIFIRDPGQKLLTERRLPPDLQGKAISEGPLPFLFGAKADDMKARYWVREVTPKNNPTGAFYIEATPRRTQDAQNYEKIVIVLQQMTKHKNHLLPVKMRITYRTIRSKSKTSVVLGTRRDEYTFQDHRVNDTRDRARNFFAKFVKPDVPKDWKRQTVDWNGASLDRPVANRSDPAKQATRPKPRPRQ